MKIPKDEFLRLQQQWYEKIAELGFKDIEKMHNGEFVLTKTASDCYRGADAFTRETKEEYFRCMAQMAQDDETIFRNETDRYILIRHSEGAKIKVIMKELNARGWPRVRASIRYIIRRYELAWGFRRYERCELNLKKKA